MFETLTDWFGAFLQFVITWSGFVAVCVLPIALVCLLVAIISPTRRATALSWSFPCLWPWELYVWTVGFAITVATLGRLGWLAPVVFFGVFMLAGARVKWFGILVVAWSGNLALAGWLTGICVAVFGWRMLSLWLISRLEDEDEMTEVMVP